MSGEVFQPRGPLRLDSTWAQRLTSRIEVTESCWLWMGAVDRGGYGVYTSLVHAGIANTAAAHRLVYLWFCDAIPDGLHLDHLCRVRNCVNPAHLEPVTSRENSRRSPLVLKDSCPAGHPYVDGSFYVDRGRRACRECKLVQVRAYAARTGRSTARFVCEFCGASRNLTERSKHIKRAHPEHYEPRKASEGLTPERRERRLAQQRARRGAASQSARSARGAA